LILLDLNIKNKYFCIRFNRKREEKRRNDFFGIIEMISSNARLRAPTGAIIKFFDKMFL